jgi:hypothetical protein
MLCTSIVRPARKRCKDPKDAFYFGGNDGIHYARLIADRNRRGENPAMQRSLSNPNPHPPSRPVPKDTGALIFDKYHHFSEGNVRLNARSRPALEGEATFADKSFDELVEREWLAGKRIPTPTTLSYMQMPQKMKPYHGKRSEYREGSVRAEVFPDRHITYDELMFNQQPRLFSSAKYPVESNII